MLKRNLFVLILSTMTAISAAAQEKPRTPPENWMRKDPEPAWEAYKRVWRYRFTVPPPPTREQLEGTTEDLMSAAQPCLGDYECLHGTLHPAYSVAFAQLQCYCYSGRCRPTKYRNVTPSLENPTGIEVWANQEWCPVPESALRRNREKVPRILLQFPAHVCVSKEGCRELECVILGSGT